MKSFLSFIIGIAYIVTVFGGVIMHLWGVAEVWEYTRGFVGFIIFVCSIFTILLTELYIAYQHIKTSGWFGDPYATATTIHFISFGVLLLLFPILKYLDKPKTNRLGLSKDEFDEFIRIGSMSPAELFSDYREPQDEIEQENIVIPEKESVGVNKEWLLEQVILEEVEKESLCYVEQVEKSIPFGFAFSKWNKLKDQFQEGDELWKYSSPSETWQRMHGRAGYCIVRSDEIVAKFVTVQN